MNNSRRTRQSTLIAWAIFLTAVTAASAVEPLKLKIVKVRGVSGHQSHAWIPTSGKAGPLLANRQGTGDRELGIAFLRSNGKTKPFKAILPANADVEASIAWPDDSSSRRAGKQGLLVVLERKFKTDDSRTLRTAPILANGRVKGALKSRLSLPASTGGSAQVLAVMGGGGVGVLIAYSLDGDAILAFQGLDSSGNAVGTPRELSYPGKPAETVLTIHDIVADSNGWHALVSGQAGSAGRLLAVSIPSDETRRRPASVTEIDSEKAPSGSDNVRYADASFVRGTGASLIFYSRRTRWTTEAARQRGVMSPETTRFLQPYDGGGRAGARMTVEIETWPRLAEIYAFGPTASPGVPSEATSLAVPMGKQHLFAVARGATRAVLGTSSFSEPRQEVSTYVLDTKTGKATLRSLANRADDVGSFSALQLVPFGKQLVALFPFGLTFSDADYSLLGEI